MTGLDPPPGAAADPSDPDALAAAVRAFLADPQVRERLAPARPGSAGAPATLVGNRP